MVQSFSALIIGCGYVASRWKSLLEEKGWEVWGARRSTQPGHDNIPIDISSEFSLSHHDDVIFYMVSAGAYKRKSYENAYSLGVFNTLQTIQKSNQNPKFIFVSSTGVFAENNGALVTEDSPTKAILFSTDSRLHGENQIASSRLEYSILRLSGIYRPSRYHLIDKIRSGGATLKKDSFKWRAKKLSADDLPTESQTSKLVHMTNKCCRNAKIICSDYVFLYPSFREGFFLCL